MLMATVLPKEGIELVEGENTTNTRLRYDALWVEIIDDLEA
jgi:hypothetical protein